MPGRSAGAGAAMAALVAMLAACTAGTTRAPGGTADRATCERAMQAYDTAAWLYPVQRLDDNETTPPAALSSAVGRVRDNGCLTSGEDLANLPALAERLAPFTIDNSGPATGPTTVQLGIVTGINDEGRVTDFVRSLGYRSRGIGAEGLGRRLFIGPLTTESAVTQALAVAREAGFIAPIVAKHTTF